MRLMTRGLVLPLMAAALLVPDLASANGPIGLSEVRDADDASPDMPIDIKLAQSHVFGGDQASGTTMFAIESYGPFDTSAIGRRFEGDSYTLQFLVSYTRKHRGPDMVFTVYNDGDLGLRYHVSDYLRGQLPGNEDAPRPSDTTLAIFFRNELIPVKNPKDPEYRWGVRYAHISAGGSVIEVDRAPDAKLVLQDGF